MGTIQRRPVSVKDYADIEGWFHRTDRQLFSAILQSQSDSPPGTLVELGCYLGKSAVVIGQYLRSGEEFVVVDLFGDPASEASDRNRVENHSTYPGLTRELFEENYRSVCGSLPTIVQGPSSTILDHVAAGSTRFLHVDASHLYPEVRIDVLNAKKLLRPGGVVIFDDFRSVHTPGVAAAVWEAVFNQGLIPIAVTHGKFYGCFSEPDGPRDVIGQTAIKHGLGIDEQEIDEYTVLRIHRTDDGGWSRIAREVGQQIGIQRWPGYRVMRQALRR